MICNTKLIVKFFIQLQKKNIVIRNKYQKTKKDKVNPNFDFDSKI